MKIVRMATLVLGLGLLLAVGLGCGPGTPAASEEVELGPLTTAAIEWDLPNMTIDHWANAAEVVVLGTVVKIDPPRWNTRDGRPARQGGDDPERIVYQTFYVEPSETLKGRPQWGTPIAFRGVFWNSPTGGGRFAVGDTVVAFGYLDPKLYGGGVYQPAEAYWLISGQNSLWVKEDRNYVTQGTVGNRDEQSLDLDELKGRIREGGGPTTLGMWDPARESMHLGWGETAWIEGVLQVTATAPQRDPSARPVESAPDGVVVYCTVTITNIGTRAREIDPNWFTLMSEHEGWSGGGDGLRTSITPALAAGTIEPGETVTGAVSFQFSPEEVARIRTLRFDTWLTRKTERPIVLIEWGWWG